jgi:hypothetical protein
LFEGNKWLIGHSLTTSIYYLPTQLLQAAEIITH